jgi:integrase
MAGHITKRTHRRADGSKRDVWRARFPDPLKGGTYQIEKTCATKREAVEWLDKQKQGANSGSFVDPRRANRPFTEVVDAYLATKVHRAPKTRGGHRSIINRHILPAFGRSKIGAVSAETVQTFINELSATHSPNTVRHVYSVLNGIYSVAVRRRYIAVNPCVDVELPARGDRGIEINPLTHAEVGALVDALPEWWRLPVLLAAYTGLRAGELWALRRNDVDGLRGEITVDEALKEVSVREAATVSASDRLTPSLIVGPTKTYAVRPVSVPAFLRTALADHLTRALPGGNDPDSFIFTTPTGEPVRHNLFYKRVFLPAARAAFPARTKLAEAKARREAEAKGQEAPKHVSPIRFHDLRHTCAAWLIERGAHPLQIKLRLGHKEIRTTMDTYGHLFPSAEPELADLLDAGYRAAQPDNVAELRPVEA